MSSTNCEWIAEIEGFHVALDTGKTRIHISHSGIFVTNVEATKVEDRLTSAFRKAAHVSPVVLFARSRIR